MITLLWNCPAPATTRVEAYSPADGRLHGSLDAAAHVCADHVEDAQVWVKRGGMAAFVCSSELQPPAIPCGTAHHYEEVAQGTA